MKGTKREREDVPEPAAKAAKAARAPVPLDLKRLGEVAPNGLDQFLNGGDAARLRRCSRAFHGRFGPAGAAALWRRLRPGVAWTVAAARDLAPAGAAMLFGLYRPAQLYDLGASVRQAACAAGNLPLIRWCRENGHDGHSDAWDDFETAFKHGHVAVARAIAPAAAGRYGGHTIGAVIGECCTSEELAMADWMLETYGHASDKPASAYFAAACLSDSVASAEWVLSRFPLDLAIGEQFLELACKYNAAAAVIRWVLECIPVGEDYLRAHVWAIANALSSGSAGPDDSPDDGPDDAAPGGRQTPYRWFVANYSSLLDETRSRENERQNRRWRRLQAMMAGGPAPPGPPAPPSP